MNIKNQRLLFKTRADGFEILVRVNERKTTPKSFKPRIKLDDDLQLDFAIAVIDPMFFDYTEVTRETLLFYGNYRPYTEDDSFPLISKNNDELLDRFEIHTLTTQQPVNDMTFDSAYTIVGVISFKTKGDASSHNLTCSNHILPQQTPVFKIEFSNRKAFWRYYKKPVGISPKFSKQTQFSMGCYDLDA